MYLRALEVQRRAVETAIFPVVPTVCRHPPKKEICELHHFYTNQASGRFLHAEVSR